MPQSLTQFTFQHSEFTLHSYRKPRARDASGNPFACLLQKIEAGQPGSWCLFAGTRTNTKHQHKVGKPLKSIEKYEVFYKRKG